MAGKIDVDVDDDGRFMLKTDPMFAKELGRALRDIAGLARKIVATEHEKPRKTIVNRQVVTKPATGRLRRSIQPYAGRAARIHKTSPHTISGEVTAGSARARYARYVHEGTLPHVIRARKPGGVLVFYGQKNGSFIRRRIKLRDESMLRPDQLKYRNDRKHLYEQGRRRLRTRDKDTYLDEETVKRADRVVAVPEVNHPGYRGHRFLNQAAAIVLSRKYGASIPSALVANGGFGGRAGPRGV